LFFCHGEGLQAEKLAQMSAEDISFIFNVARINFGCQYTTLTGGEPLLRSDIIDIAARIYSNFGKITLTTNGVLLEEKIDIGNYLKRLNISLHSIDPTLYGIVTGRSDVFHKVVCGLEHFRRCFPDVEICINVTLLRSYNFTKDSIDALLNFASKLNASVKFIELYSSSLDEFVSIKEMESHLLLNGFVPAASTRRKKNYSKGSLMVGLTKIFCASANDYDKPSYYCLANNDLFISPDGKIKPCRHNKEEIDILPEALDRDSKGLSSKLSLAFSMLGKDCCSLNIEKSVDIVKCIQI
jgi:cyclic pyranopterin phosphate synthase